MSCTTPLLKFRDAPLLGKLMTKCSEIEPYVKSFSPKVDFLRKGNDIALSLCFPP